MAYLMEINGNIEEGQKEAVYRSRFLVSSFRSSFRKRSLRNTNGQNFLFKRRQLGTLLPKQSNASYIHRVEYLYFVQIHSRGYSLFLSIRLSTNRSFFRPEKRWTGRWIERSGRRRVGWRVSNRVVCIITSLRVHTSGSRWSSWQTHSFPRELPLVEISFYALVWAS